MDIKNKTKQMTITRSLAEWLHFIDLIDLASDSVVNKKLASKLRDLSREIFSDIAPLGTFEVHDD